jgi:hypothetical protein
MKAQFERQPPVRRNELKPPQQRLGASDAGGRSKTM